MHLCAEGAPDISGNFGVSGDVSLCSLFGPVALNMKGQIAVKFDEVGQREFGGHAFVLQDIKHSEQSCADSIEKGKENDAGGVDKGRRMER